MEEIYNYNGVDSTKVVEKLSGMFGNTKGEQKKVKDAVEVKKDINHMTAEEVQDSLYKRTEPDMDNFKDFDTLKVADYIISHSSEYFDYHPNELTNNMIDIVKAYVRDINLLGICIANHIKNLDILDMKILNGMEGLMDAFSAEYPEVSCLWKTRNNLHEYINSQRHAQINLYNALTGIMMRYNMLSDLAKDIPEKKIVLYRIINGKKFRLDDTINSEDIACYNIIKSVFGYRNGDCNGFSFGREELERAERQLGY